MEIEQYSDPELGLQELQKPLSNAHSQPLSRPGARDDRLRLRKLPSRLVSASVDYVTGGPEGYAFRRFIRQSIDIVELNRIYAALEFLPLWLFLELPEYYFEAGLGSLGQTEAASYQQLGFVEIYYGDKDQRLHVDFNTQESHFVVYHQPFYRKTDIGEAVAGIVRDYLAEPDQ